MNIRQAVSILAKVFVISGVLLMAVAAAVIYGLPTLLKHKAPEIMQSYVDRTASIADIDLGVFPPALRLKDFSIKEKNGQLFASFETLYLQIDPLSSITQATIIIDKLLLDKPFIHIVKGRDGTFNFSDLMQDKADKDAGSRALFPVAVTKLSLSAGRLAWEDDSSGQSVTDIVAPIQLDIDGLTTRVGAESRLALSLALASGARMNWAGAFGINPVHSQGQIKLDGVNLQKIPVSAMQKINLQGDVIFETDYQFSVAEDKLEMSINNARINARDLQYETNGRGVKLAEFMYGSDLTFNGSNNNWQLSANKAKINSRDIRLYANNVQAKLSDLTSEAGYKVGYNDSRLNVTVSQGKLDAKAIQLSEQNKQLAAIPSIVLQGIALNLDDQQLSADAIAVNDATVKAWLNGAGMMNYQALLPAAKDDNQQLSDPTDQKKTAWQIAADSVALNNCALDFEDQTLPKPFAIIFKPIDFKLTGFSNQSGAKLPFQLSVGLNKNGLIALNGSTTMTPLSADIGINVKDIDLANYQAYFDRFIRLDVIDGLLAIDGQMSIAKDDKLDIKFNGNTHISELLTRDQRVHKDFVKWQNLSLKDMAIDVLAKRYTAKALVIDKPYARVTIRKDKTVNFSGLVIGDDRRSASAVKKNDAAYFKLDKIQVKDGSSDFTDLSLILPFSAHIQALNGGADSVSSEKNASFNVMLKGNAYDLAPVDVTGKISPYLGDYNVAVNFKGLPMPLISPYMVQFAGYKVEKGKMSLELDYNIANKQLTASNKLLIDRFELGEKIDNPNAVSIPFKLAVALLKDSNGRIKFDVPITGSLENPQFSLGAVITDALVNAISKIVSSPFHALASLMGSRSEEDLSTIRFNPGSSTLNAKQLAKLSDLSKALQQRPHLTLEIKGVTVQQQDWPAISDDALYDQLKIRRAAEINQKGVLKIRSEYVELSTEEYRRLLAELFIEKFPLLAEKNFLGSPKLRQPQNGDFYELAKQKLLEVINPEQERLKDLAAARAQAIAKYIVQKGGIAQERVYILDPVVNPGKDGEDIVSLLSLKTD